MSDVVRSLLDADMSKWRFVLEPFIVVVNVALFAAAAVVEDDDEVVEFRPFRLSCDDDGVAEDDDDPESSVFCTRFMIMSIFF